jgi:hypothetical protein
LFLKHYLRYRVWTSHLLWRSYCHLKLSFKLNWFSNLFTYILHYSRRGYPLFTYILHYSRGGYPLFTYILHYSRGGYPLFTYILHYSRGGYPLYSFCLLSSSLQKSCTILKREMTETISGRIDINIIVC